ncbi:MAG: response regulator transcription factor [Rhodoferax sp.]|nr:response regulator transcription factor [Rhodoferax sp.]
MRSLNIIVVEDNDDLRESTHDALKALGHAMRGVKGAPELDIALANGGADLLILDINLPGEDGLCVARRMRQSTPDIGIIMVTARARLEDKMQGYASGADIYLTKPVAMGELSAAIQAVARRLNAGTPNPPHALTLDASTLQLFGTLETVGVSKREAQLLEAFAKAPEHMLDNLRLTALSSASKDDLSKGAIEVQIVRLRKKLEQAGACGPTFKAIRGTGYQLCVPLVLQNTPIQSLRHA